MRPIHRSRCRGCAHHHLAAGAALLAALAVAGTAGAQGRDWQPKKQGHRLGAQLEVWPVDGGTTVTGEFVGQIAVLDELMIDFSLPSAYGSYDFFGPNVDAFILGNPAAGLHWGDKVIDALALWAGGKITFPILIDPDPEPALVGSIASGNRAFFDLDRFALERMTVRPQFGLEAHFARWFYFRTDVAAPIYIPVADNVDNDPETSVVIEHGNEFEGRSNIGLGAGGRLQFLFVATDSAFGNDDRFQAAIEPYFVFEPHGEDGFFARVGTLIALDSPLGFGLDEGKLATFRVTLGGKW
jgi:hypothetical protein